MKQQETNLKNKIRILNEKIWEGRAKNPAIEDWLSNFDVGNMYERLQALFLLSNFMYFGGIQMRELLKSVYRDLYKYPIIERIRKDNSDTIQIDFINGEFDKALHSTRFLGVGNPSESGCHLLYYFRQENSLPKKLFIHTHKMFYRDPQKNKIALRFPDVKRYVFIDDFCGSGSQGVDYSKDLLEDLKSLNENIHVSYYVLFATSSGLENIRSKTLFDSVESVYCLDNTFKCFDEYSRIFQNEIDGVDKDQTRKMCLKYGKQLYPDCPLGFGDCQLLIGFYHNIPDNTLPIIWDDLPRDNKWKPIFKRYSKIYDW